ncbi:MAG: DUF6152 family protein [Candidatus Rariloculaceae bacterium]
MMQKRYATVTTAISFIWLGFTAESIAHHGPIAEPLYNTSELIELHGEVTGVFWRNPHARFRIRVTSGPETGEIWQIETNTPASLRRNGFPPELLPIGSTVTVAGAVSRRKPREMGLFNLLLPNGLEFADIPRPNPLRYSNQRLDRNLNLEQTQARNSEPDDAPSGIDVEAARREANGIFRVWQRDRGAFGGLDENALTAAALAAKMEYDVMTDLRKLDCIPPGMPTSMMNPSVFQFVDEGDRIVLRVQLYDVVRTIHMNSDVDPETQPLSPLGYSVGKWDNDSLVVTTTRIDEPFSNSDGVPQSAEVMHIERFTPAADGSTMDYDLATIDPIYLVGPQSRPGSFTWRPERQIAEHGCTVWE